MTGAELLRALHAAGCELRVDGSELVCGGPVEVLEALREPLARWRDVLWTLHHPGVRDELARWPSWALDELHAERARLEAEGAPRALATRLALLDVGTRHEEDEEGAWKRAA